MTQADLTAQINAAFDFRGHVTVTLGDGATMVGFLFNRELAGAAPFVSLVLQGSAEEVELPLARIRSVELTGKDHAEFGAIGKAQAESE